jgi:DNA-binding transcriptional ArsR family regulator
MAHGVEGRITPTQITLDVAREVAQTVGQLAEAIQMEQSAVSHQLRTLRHLGLVVGDRRGRNVLYALHDDHVATLLEEAVYHVEHLHLGVSDSATAQ